MSASLWLVLSAVAIGAAVPVQSAINAQMAAVQGHPLYGAIANTTVATLCLLVLIVCLRVSPPRMHAAAAAPAYLWVGGVVGAAFVFGALYVSPRVGAALFAAATIIGTAIASLLIDHFGLFGFPQRSLSVARLAGVGCLLLGIVLLQSDRS